MKSSLIEKTTALIARIPDDIIILMGRVGLGAFFVRAGQTKVDGFTITDTTRYLFAEEYMVPLLSPEVAAWLATISEHLLGGLLIIGLATRLSGAGLLGMTVVIELFVYPASWPDHLMWAAVLLLIISRGPGRYSLDSALSRLFSHSPTIPTT